MLSEAHIRYLLEEVVLLSNPSSVQSEIRLDETQIHIRLGGKTYSEALFPFSLPQLNANDFQLLQRISDDVQNNRPIDSSSWPDQTGLLKMIHFFINEFYLDPEQSSDRHGRVSSRAIQPPYEAFLRFPVTDILIRALWQRLDIPAKTPFRFYFSCDFDILNPWHMPGKFFGIPRVLWALMQGRFSKFINEVPSIFFSGSSLKYNYYLNDKMFYEPADILEAGNAFEIRNLAFWLFDTGNSNYDFHNNFRQRSFRRFQNRLNYFSCQQGLHTNYNSFSRNSLHKQKRKFFSLLHRHAEFSRAHYLRLRFPEDLWHLQENGILTDHTYCFPDSLHFRGGRTAEVHLWSFAKQQSIPVKSVPICLSDTILSEYLKLSAQEAFDQAARQIQLTMQYGFGCSLLWHNSNTYRFGGDRRNYHHQLILKIKRHIRQMIRQRNENNSSF